MGSEDWSVCQAEEYRGARPAPLRCVHCLTRRIVVGSRRGVAIAVRAAGVSIYGSIQTLAHSVGAVFIIPTQAYSNSTSVLLFTQFSALWVDTVLSSHLVGHRPLSITPAEALKPDSPAKR